MSSLRRQSDFIENNVPIKVALITLGSAGDVHPLLALGRALQERGHDVVVLSLPNFQAEAEGVGLRFVAVGSADVYEKTIRHPKLWDPVDGVGVLWRYLLRPLIGPSYEALSALIQQGVQVLVAPPVVMGARLASERWGVPLLSVYTAATLLRSERWPLTLGSWRVPRGLPSWVLRVVWRSLDRWGLEPLVAKDLNTWRRRLGLPPVDGSVFGQWMHSPHGGVALFEPWFAAAPDWPAQVKHAGFMLYEQDEPSGLPPRVSDFLNQGPPPVVFLSGTAQVHANHVYEAAIASCAQRGWRALLIGPDAPECDRPDVCTARYAPLGKLLPRVRAVVHHGGVGTCAQALRAGVPQVVLPSAFDQFDNAMRIEQLGVGRSMPMKRVQAQALGALLSAVLDSQAVQDRCREAAKQVQVSRSRERACECVEALLISPPNPFP